MALRNDAKSIHSTIEKRFESDSTILKNAAELFGFAAAASAGEPLSLLTGIALITKTAGAALAASGEIIRRTLSPTSEQVKVPEYDRFRILFYTTCMRAYIETLPEALGRLKPPEFDEKEAKKAKKLLAGEMTEHVQMQLAKLGEAEVFFLFGITPLENEVPLFAAFSEWLVTTLKFYGFDPAELRKLGAKCAQEASNRFHVFLASENDDAKWMSGYLALSRTAKAAQTITDLTSAQESLAEWVGERAGREKNEEAVWTSYRKELRELPDASATMFSETFGVREVFVKPEASYFISGAPGDAGKPTKVPDLATVVAALTTNRTSGDDLIILSGGPGSGKSTFCRVFASQLATDRRMSPVFLRLRRLAEGSDIGSFVETAMYKRGLISEPADLHDLPNFVLILDGFDELVMASRARLRQFFNVLREEHNSGVLRAAKIVVSGRDTLFPQGEGLPRGSHVLTLLPFERSRVKAWGRRWRTLHRTGTGSDFKPEKLLSENSAKPTPLQHLVTWPLTLHLVARVHTAGHLNVAGRSGGDVEKAHLYRSIVAEAAERQQEQTDGSGRLGANEMRQFLRALAWKMYDESRDCLDPADAIPLLGTFFKGVHESELPELADVAIVNCPELQKGEETGFEFVHKSFSEYLVAERIAHAIEEVAFQAPEYGSEDITWRMSEQEAAASLGPMVGARLITAEVQEMLEPMLGTLEQFLKGVQIGEGVDKVERRVGLQRIVNRLEGLHKGVLDGRLLKTIAECTRGRAHIQNVVDAYANFSAGIMIIGSAAARQFNALSDGQNESSLYFRIARRPREFWRGLSLLEAGGIRIDNALSKRMLEGTAISDEDNQGVSDLDIPFKPCHLAAINGYRPDFTEAAAEQLEHIAGLRLTAELAMAFAAIVMARSQEGRELDRAEYAWHVVGRSLSTRRHSRFLHRLASSGMLKPELIPAIEYHLDQYVQDPGEVFHHALRLDRPVGLEELMADVIGRSLRRSHHESTDLSDAWAQLMQTFLSHGRGRPRLERFLSPTRRKEQ